MTVCIAGIHRQSNTLIGVSDMMVSTEWTSGDLRTLKMVKIADDWEMMFAGNVSAFSPISNSTHSKLSTIGKPTGEDVSNAVAAAFIEYRQQICEQSILSPYGLTIRQFVDGGRQYFGDGIFDAIRRQIEDTHIGLEVLVFGFDKPDDVVYEHIFSVEDHPYSRRPCVPEYHDRIGFHAIGSGSITAQGALLANTRNLITDASLAETIFRLCEAKFLSESAPGVGRETVILTMEYGEQPYFVLPSLVAEIKKAWESTRSVVVAPVALKATEKVLEAATMMNGRQRSKGAAGKS